MILSDGHIRLLMKQGLIQIEPNPWDECMQPASVDLRLGPTFQVFRQNHEVSVVDPLERQDLTETVTLEVPGGLILHPREFMLAATEEVVKITGEGIALPDDPSWRGLAGRVEGKSSLGRIGLLIHSTAGYIDPGFRGNITLELSNVSNLPIRLTPGMRICQIQFLLLSSPPERPYGHPGLKSHYQDSTGAIAARLGD